MKPETIMFRSINKKDYPYIEDIIRKTWKYDALSSNPKDAQHMSHLYLCSCLERTTFSRVAVRGNRVLGVILASSKNSMPKIAVRRKLAQFYAIMLLYSTKTGRQIGKLFNTFNQADIELLKNSQHSFDAEICLFAVDERARGTGIGKKLFSAALKYLKYENAKSFYLFTDSSCTYQFYEKRGMQRLGEKIVEVKPYRNYQLNMFIYGYKFTTESKNQKSL